MFFRIICSELLRTFTKETFLFEIFFHFSPIKTFPFGLILMGHISVFQVNDSKSMNFFYNFNIFRISCDMHVYKQLKKRWFWKYEIRSPTFPTIDSSTFVQAKHVSKEQHLCFNGFQSKKSSHHQLLCAKLLMASRVCYLYGLCWSHIDRRSYY